MLVCRGFFLRLKCAVAQKRLKNSALVYSEDCVMDLGKKLSTPKDIMLEELSLLSNRGSRLFKMRQRRSEKYTFESIQNETNTLLTVNFMVDPSTQGDQNANNPASGKCLVSPCHNSTGVHKTYHTPWEEAILSDPDLAETIKLRMPEPNPQPELPQFRCFNRVATPYGGFDKAPRGITFKLPEVDLNPPRFPELNESRMKRPTFNRTAQGWISEGTHLIIPTITLEPTSVPESDDL
uniref:Myozenin 2b n=1 Tax=Oryzias sinensis TaxID=183150 RepID=A0A8C7YIP2_9TELE